MTAPTALPGGFTDYWEDAAERAGRSRAWYERAIEAFRAALA